ncbi:unnamed protein product, partial [Allacma fusca]
MIALEEEPEVMIALEEEPE